MNRGQVITAGMAGLGLVLSAVVGIWGNWFVASVLAIVAIGGPTAALYLASNNKLPSLTPDKSIATKTDPRPPKPGDRPEQP